MTNKITTQDIDDVKELSEGVKKLTRETKDIDAELRHALELVMFKSSDILEKLNSQTPRELGDNQKCYEGRTVDAYTAMRSMNHTPQPQQYMSTAAKHLRGCIFLDLWKLFYEDVDTAKEIALIGELVKLLKQEIEQPTELDYLEWSHKFRKHMECISDFLD